MYERQKCFLNGQFQNNVVHMNRFEIFFRFYFKKLQIQNFLSFHKHYQIKTDTTEKLQLHTNA